MYMWHSEIVNKSNNFDELPIKKGDKVCIYLQIYDMLNNRVLTQNDIVDSSISIYVDGFCLGQFDIYSDWAKEASLPVRWSYDNVGVSMMYSLANTVITGNYKYTIRTILKSDETVEAFGQFEVCDD